MKKFGKLLLSLSVAGVVAYLMNNIHQNMQQKEEKVSKFKDYYNIVSEWLALKQEGKGLTEFFVENGYKTIAIYGMGELGNRLYEELKNTDIEVKYAIDQNGVSDYPELQIIESGSNVPRVDVMVVTAVFAFDDIYEKYEGMGPDQIVSLKDVVYWYN